MALDHETLPSRQHAYPGLPELSEGELYRRRERLFLLFAAVFLGTLAMLNILGITRFIHLFSLDHDGDPTTGAVVFAVAVGVLPYPVTFLCTDFISELFGRRRANQVVWAGLLVNLWVVAVLWIGGLLPGFEALGSDGRPIADTVQSLTIDGVRADRRLPVFFEVRALAFGAVAASMIAYLAAQFVDVQLFHFWKRLTGGRHLWLRNNGSTLVSQLIDTVAVILITHFYARALYITDDRSLWSQLLVFIGTGYVFKLVVALLDTIPFYLGAPRLARYLRLPPPGNE